jgi:DNA-binding CsgD family transcriptional regulator
VQNTDSSTDQVVDLAQIAERLHARSKTLTNRLVSVVWEQVSGYDTPYLELEELTDRVHQTVRAVINAIVDDRVGLDAFRRAYELGTRRARQGLPLESIVLSYRNAERVLTNALRTETQELRAGDLQEGMRRMVQALDELTAASIDGYHSTESELKAHRDSLSTDLIVGLAYGDLGSNQILALSRSLGCEPLAPYTAVAVAVGATGGTATMSVQRDLIAALAPSTSGRMVVGTAREAKVLLVPGALEDADVERVRAVLDRHDEVEPRTALGEPVSDITKAGMTCRQALRALAVAKTTTRLVCYRDLIPDLVASMIDQDLHAWLVEHCQRPLTGRTQLHATIAAFVANNMSARQTASALSVHPNTVHYRLKRIRELTGMDPRSTTELFSLLLAARLEAPDATSL